MRRLRHLTVGVLSSALVLLLAGCSEPQVVDTWKGKHHGATVKVEILEDGTRRVSASYGVLGQKSLEDLKADVEQGSVDAAMALAVLYWYGAGPEGPNGKKAFPPDKAKAAGYYRQAAVKDHVRAQLILADLYASGADGIEQNLAESTRLLGKAAGAGEVDAQCRLAAMYDRGEGVTEDRAEAAKFYQPCAQSGDGAAMLRLAEIYETGEGVPRNKTAAVEWYRRAAEAKQPRALCRLAVLYDTGQGVVQDLSEAADLYRTCAETGDGAAMLRLAQIYEFGQDDRATALEWYHKAAGADEWRAKCHLAALYDTGEGVQQDLSEAIKWYEGCAKGGLGLAMFRLAELYDKGLGVPKKPKLAADYMIKALKANVEQAKNEMLARANTWSVEFRKEFQRNLQAENLYNGKIDGILGRGTQGAIKSLAGENS